MGETGPLMATLDSDSRPFAPMSEGLMTYRRGGPVWPRVLFSSWPSSTSVAHRVTLWWGLTSGGTRLRTVIV